MEGTQLRERPQTDTQCPTCGAPAENGQLICLECGSRIALGYRRPPSWRVPVAIISVVVLAAAAGVFFGLRAIEDDADQEVASQPVPNEPQGSGEDGDGGEDGNGGGQANENEKTGSDKEKGENEQARKDRAERERAERERAERERAERERAQRERAQEEEASGTQAPAVGADGIRSWRGGEDGFTVIILSSEDRRSARAFAAEAVNSGVKAGVLRADDYPALAASTGFFIVFVGSYPNQAGADRAAARLGRRYRGAYPQFVDGSKAKR